MPSPGDHELLDSDAAAPRRRPTGCPRSTAARRGSGTARWPRPRTRSSAPWPSAVAATSTPGARWKRIAKGTVAAPGAAARLGDRAGPRRAARCRRRAGRGARGGRGRSGGHSRHGSPRSECRSPCCLVADELDLADALAERAVDRGSRSNCGRRAPASNGRRWRAARWTRSARHRPPAPPTPPQLTTSRLAPSELEGQGRGAAAARMRARRRRGGVDQQHRLAGGTR